MESWGFRPCQLFAEFQLRSCPGDRRQGQIQPAVWWHQRRRILCLFACHLAELRPWQTSHDIMAISYRSSCNKKYRSGYPILELWEWFKPFKHHHCHQHFGHGGPSVEGYVSPGRKPVPFTDGVYASVLCPQVLNS